MRPVRPARRLMRRAIALTIVAILIYFAVSIFPALRDFYKAGIFNQLGERKYNGDVSANLKALRTALMLYHDSEGQFPIADHWMEAVQPRIQTDDLSGKEAEKKLRDPYFGVNRTNTDLRSTTLLRANTQEISRIKSSRSSSNRLTHRRTHTAIRRDSLQTRLAPAETWESPSTAQSYTSTPRPDPTPNFRKLY